MSRMKVSNFQKLSHYYHAYFLQEQHSRYILPQVDENHDQ